MSRRLACIYNDSSGSAQDKRTIQELFAIHGFAIDFLDIKTGEQALERKIRQQAYKAIVAAGGDGTVRQSAQLAVAAGLPLGVLPVGTLNHFAKDLQLPLDLEEAVKVIAKMSSKKVDYCTVNDLVFVNNASIGIYPATVLGRGKIQNKLMKPLGTITAFMAALFTNHTLKCTITAPDGAWTHRSPLIFVGNNKYHIEKPGFTSREAIDQGQIFLYAVKATRRRSLLLLGFLSVFGMRVRSADFIKLTIGPVTVDSPSPTTHISLDGEVFNLPFPLNFQMHPKGLSALRIQDDSSK